VIGLTDGIERQTFEPCRGACDPWAEIIPVEPAWVMPAKGAADDGERFLGTVVVAFAHQPNAPHRAEIGRMLILSSARRQDLDRLLAAAEQAAREAGRTLLLLDTESSRAGDLPYRRCGWSEVGRVQDHAYRPDGHLAETTMFYKTLGVHRRPPTAAQ